jgi:hypothetical protein
MELGKHLRELFRLRVSTVACLALAVLAAVSMSYHIRLSPPGLQARQLQIATATSEVLVDTPYSTAVDLRQGSADIEAMTSRAALLGNVIASPPVLVHIAQRAHLPVEAIKAQPPLTAEFPRPVPQPGDERSSKDLFKMPDEYRINVQVDPSVPVLRVIAEAPTAAMAQTLANAAVSGLKDYLTAVATNDATPVKNRVRLLALGRARGVVVSGGIRYQASAIAFLLVFGLSAAAAVFLGRVRRGWREAGEREPDLPRSGAPPPRMPTLVGSAESN